MKIGSISICVTILIMYLILPFGDYSWEDMMTTYQTSLAENMSSLDISSKEFVENVVDNKEQNTNPEVDFIVHPSTAIARDGDNSVKGTLYLTSGYIRTGSYKPGAVHGAIDSDVSGYHALGKCPNGHTECADTVVIAPVSGVISAMNTNNYNYNYWAIPGKETYIEIKAEGKFAGWTMQVMHISNIPKNLKVGDKVKQGDYLGTQCAQGNSTATHMHFTVKNGSAKVHVKEWFKYLTVHSSISSIKHTTGTLSRDRQGWNDEDLAKLNSNPKYESIVVVPDEFKVK